MVWHQVTNLKSVPGTHETACFQSFEKKKKYTDLFISSQSCVSFKYMLSSTEKEIDKACRT